MDPRDYPEDTARIIATQAKVAHDVIAAAARLDSEMWRRKKDGVADMLERAKKIEAEIRGKTIEGTATRG